jgi:cardiolipin synthase (CMP-forming)
LTTEFALNLPNLITLGRLILVPVIVWLLVSGEMATAFAAFLVAGLSDAADGFLAKRFKMETELGAYLDPLADKMLIVCIFVTLGISGHLPAWLVIAVVSRDVLIVMAVVLSWVMGQPVKIKPLIVSKANTLAQIILAGTVLADEAFGLNWSVLRTLLIATTAALTVASLVSYLDRWMRHMSEPINPV